MKHKPESLDKIESEENATEFVLEVLEFSKIEFYFNLRRCEDENADDMLTYARDVCSRLVLSLAIDKCEKMEDALGLRAIRRVMIPYFLNRKCKVQDSKVIIIIFVLS